MGPMGLIGLIGPIMLACTSSSEDLPQQQVAIEVAASVGQYDGAVTSGSATRSWTPPDGYHTYSSLYGGESYVNPARLEQSTIDVFFTQGTTATLHGKLNYSTATEKWKFITKVDPNSISSGDYFAYGFIPREAADSATITTLPASTYAGGAVLTIHGLKSVATDPCVIIGAKQGTDQNTCTGLQAGDFEFNLRTGESATNYLYFLFDHLYSALSISMRVDAEYYSLRRIKLKELYLKTETTSGTTPEKTDVTITLVKNDEGTTPISTITYTPSEDDTKCDSTVYRDKDGFPLLTTYSTFMGHFMPQNVSKLIVTSVYDVYDTDDNLIRKNCKATNTMPLSELFNLQNESKRGWKYTVNMTIKPTYLYMLSEPDLDSPGMTVE